MDLMIGDLEDHKHGKKVVIKGKTGARRIPLISSVPHLQAWINNHPRGGDKDAPLWVNIGTRNVGEKMQYRAMTKALRQIGGRAGVDKPLNPHHFRHSRATYLASRFTEAQMCEWFGWVQGSDMPAKYVHLSGRDIDADYARLHGIEDGERPEKTKLAPVNCPRCGGMNDPKAKFCNRCGQALTREAFEGVESSRKMVSKALENLLRDPNFKNILRAKLKKAVKEKF
ncbi:hypothetical protein AKJ45_02560 [candidate division MSBL1 archaeon SCGC-AAA261F19]|uniref:Tyr recombinase domain-containing protein n=1 Tax=candidate division MSBL1 archaeon SCGC-AAA261F19 TaxID=1698275 RepID=A0A133V9G9_9EURY|nr:hypothetical protein AKJ45_02560 [candidate division MSBL1 archaeon SCGC-AAA261F19]